MRSPRIIVVTVLAALVGAAAGAGAYAIFNNSDSGTTVVRQVQVTQSVQASDIKPGTVLSIGSIYKLANRGVVKISVTSGGANPFEQGTQQAQGSGFVSDTVGHVITNQHVIDGAESIKVTFWNGKTYTAKLVGSDASTDTAVVKVDAPASMFHPLALADSSTVQVGDGVVAIGSPFGLEETVTSGIVSALHRQMTSPNNFTIDDSIQTDAAINHGNSGGPLLNMQGKVIGINAQIESDSGGNDGVGFAVPSDTARRIANRLISTGKAEHAYLGVSLSEDSIGARVTCVARDKPAAVAGLKPDDVVTAFAGKKITSVDALRFAVDAKKPGTHVSVTFVRDGKSHTVSVTLGARPAKAPC
ncbi:MAG: S1C family serine protease [Gaiellaceae bacterium]